MGLTKSKNGDNHIIFHVGKELPEIGEDIILVPGIANAQGRGVYCAEVPDLKYIGGEHFKKEMNIAPIFLIPMAGKWIKGVLKKKDNAVVYHSEGRAIALRDLRYIEVEEQGQRIRYYYSENVSFFPEPKTQIYDEVFGRIRNGRLKPKDAIERLRESGQEECIDQEIIVREIKRAMTERRIPESAEMLRELETASETEQMPEARIRFG